MAKPELADHSRCDYLGVANRQVDISKIILGPESTERARAVIAGILKRKASVDRVAIGKLVIDSPAVLLIVCFARPAVEKILEDIAARIHLSLSVRERQKFVIGNDPCRNGIKLALRDLVVDIRFPDKPQPSRRIHHLP